jgi:polyisoprenoid-binding protein YceI
VTVKGEDKFTLAGDITVKDVTRSIEFDVEFTGAAVDVYGNHRVGFEATTTLSRKDFGMTWNAALETGGVLVSDKITVEVEVSAIKAG